MNINIKFILFVLALASIQRCSSGWPEWLLKAPLAVSPDGKAAVYQSLNKIDGKYTISVSTWIKGGWADGGSGIFDYHNESPAAVILNWESDTTIIIKYPEDADIIRQEYKIYFMGRATSIIYQSISSTDPN